MKGLGGEHIMAPCWVQTGRANGCSQRACMKHSSLWCCYLLTVVSFSIQTTANCLCPTLFEQRARPKDSSGCVSGRDAQAAGSRLSNGRVRCISWILSGSYFTTVNSSPAPGPKPPLADCEAQMK